MNASQNGTEIAITPAQSRAARGFLGLSQDQLAERSGIPKRTIVRFELGEGAPRSSTIEAIRIALEAAGVEFSNGDTPGVNLRSAKPQRPVVLIYPDPSGSPLSQEADSISDALSYVRNLVPAQVRPFAYLVVNNVFLDIDGETQISVDEQHARLRLQSPGSPFAHLY